MVKTNWNKTLSEVLKQETKQLELVSSRTGNSYTTDIVPELTVVSTGSVEKTSDGLFKYSIVDVAHNLEYAIKTPSQVKVSFGLHLRFFNVRGGATSNGTGWYSADAVEIVEK
ncbi:TPA: hypothetical protein TZS69_000555 [Streptococcus suis]|nr:hypothetical protein [Streptococcus suis]